MKLQGMKIKIPMITVNSQMDAMLLLLKKMH
jgi:hypothetical protein